MQDFAKKIYCKTNVRFIAAKTFLTFYSSRGMVTWKTAPNRLYNILTYSESRHDGVSN